MIGGVAHATVVTSPAMRCRGFDGSFPAFAALAYGPRDEAFGTRRTTDAELFEVRRRIGFPFQDSDAQLFSPTVVEDVASARSNLALRVNKPERSAIERAPRLALPTAHAHAFGRPALHRRARESAGDGPWDFASRRAFHRA